MGDDNQQYKFNNDILNILSSHPDDDYEVGARGWVKPDSNIQHASWAIFLNKPWRNINTEDSKSTSSVARAYIDSQTTVYSLMSDKMQDWSKQGLTEYRDAINEVLALWEDLDEQESKEQ